MKTKEQIIEWLKSQEWYEAFAKNVSPITVEEDVKHDVEISKDFQVIKSAFIWKDTDEGYDFWHNVDREFIKWFNSDEQAEQSSEDEQTEPSSDRWIFDRGSKEAPFYMVYPEGKSSPTLKHGSMEEATKEADRLAKSLNTKTYVLVAVLEIRPEVVTSAVSVDDMEHQVDNPF